MIVTVRFALLPPKTILLVGTSFVLDEEPVKVTPPRGESTSPTVRLMVPLVPLLEHAPPAATVTVGGSLTAFTVMLTVTAPDSAPLASRAL